MEKNIKEKPARYYDSKDHLPEPERVVIGYNMKTSSYHLCTFCPETGWNGLNMEFFSQVEKFDRITHWLDTEIDLPFKTQVQEHKMQNLIDKEEYCDQDD